MSARLGKAYETLRKCKPLLGELEQCDQEGARPEWAKLTLKLALGGSGGSTNDYGLLVVTAVEVGNLCMKVAQWAEERQSESIWAWDKKLRITGAGRPVVGGHAAGNARFRSLESTLSGSAWPRCSASRSACPHPYQPAWHLGTACGCICRCRRCEPYEVDCGDLLGAPAVGR